MKLMELDSWEKILSEIEELNKEKYNLNGLVNPAPEKSIKELDFSKLPAPSADWDEFIRS